MRRLIRHTLTLTATAIGLRVLYLHVTVPLDPPARPTQ